MAECFRYDLVASELTVEDRTHITYGLSGPGVIFCDVSVDKQKVTEMLQKINNAQLEPCHFMYFIEDELV